jgi:hypothetical protein
LLKRNFKTHKALIALAPCFAADIPDVENFRSFCVGVGRIVKEWVKKHLQVGRK